MIRRTFTAMAGGALLAAALIGAGPASAQGKKVVIATPGRAGLGPLLAAIRAGKTIALSNKEPLVMAGGLMMEAARSSGAELLPVDSEHCAVFQCVRGESPKHIRRIIRHSGHQVGGGTSIFL